MNKYQEIYDYLCKFYKETPIEGSMLFRHYLDELYELIKEHKKLKDKETPKNVVKRTMPIIDEVYCCSKCGQHVELTQNYCDKCGQKLDWSDK